MSNARKANNVQQHSHNNNSTECSPAKARPRKGATASANTGIRWRSLLRPFPLMHLELPSSNSLPPPFPPLPTCHCSSLPHKSSLRPTPPPSLFSWLSPPETSKKVPPAAFFPLLILLVLQVPICPPFPPLKGVDEEGGERETKQDEHLLLLLPVAPRAASCLQIFFQKRGAEWVRQWQRFLPRNFAFLLSRFILLREDIMTIHCAVMISIPIASGKFPSPRPPRQIFPSLLTWGYKRKERRSSGEDVCRASARFLSLFSPPFFLLLRRGGRLCAIQSGRSQGRGEAERERSREEGLEKTPLPFLAN